MSRWGEVAVVISIVSCGETSSAHAPAHGSARASRVYNNERLAHLRDKPVVGARTPAHPAPCPRLARRRRRCGYRCGHHRHRRRTAGCPPAPRCRRRPPAAGQEPDHRCRLPPQRDLGVPKRARRWRCELTPGCVATASTVCVSTTPLRSAAEGVSEPGGGAVKTPCAPAVGPATSAVPSSGSGARPAADKEGDGEANIWRLRRCKA